MRTMYADSKGPYMGQSKLLGLGTPDWTGTYYNKTLRGEVQIAICTSNKAMTT